MKKKNKDSLISIKNASMKRGGKRLWTKLNAEIKSGEFIAVLGPNGAGKTSLIKAVLGLVDLSSGHILIESKEVTKGNRQIGYIPQQKNLEAGLNIRGVDLVGLGLNGHQFGVGDKINKSLVDVAIKEVDADDYALKAISKLSGGQQQRLRVAQAIVSKPNILLCDEPLLSLDPASQQAITKLLSDYRKQNDAAILFVTHEINPVLPYVDKVLYIANGRWILDTPDAILNSEVLSKLYNAPVEIVKIRDHILIINADELAMGGHHEDES